MKFKRVKVENFKSFKNLDLALGKFTVLIGPNASGKSNFTEIFKFLRDIQDNTLDDAISMHGGLESIRNLKMGRQSEVQVEVEFEPRSHPLFGMPGRDRMLKIQDATYVFSVGLNNVNNNIEIKKDELTRRFQIVRRKEKGKELFEGTGVLETGQVIIANEAGKLEIRLQPPDLEERLQKEEGMRHWLSFPGPFSEKIPRNTLIIRIPHPFVGLSPWGKPFGDVSVYDINPHLAKNPVQITGKSELQEEGANLALVLNKLLENKDKKQTFCNLMKDLLPFVEDIDTEKFAEKSLMIRLREDYCKDDYLRAYLLSDGTIGITALLTALVFEQKDVVIVEEPERNIHPHLIANLMDMMKDASKNKQIIVTTHSPEVVKHAGLENLLLVSRDKNGFSTVSKPAEREDVKIFLKNEIGVDELYVQNLLGE
jgi:predicted ATPase